MIKKVIEAVGASLWYGIAVLVVVASFAFESYSGTRFFPDSGVQKNAGYNGPIPHSGYGVRFYHK